MKNYLVLLCLLLPISVFAAETDIQTTSVIQTVESPMVISAQKMSPRQALQSGEWTISTLNGKVVVSPGTLTFEKKRFYVKICNGMSGNYRVLGSTLASGGTISTMMYCEWDGMALEQAMSFSRSKFMVGSDTLTIRTSKGDVMVWKKK